MRCYCLLGCFGSFLKKLFFFSCGARSDFNLWLRFRDRCPINLFFSRLSRWRFYLFLHSALCPFAIPDIDPVDLVISKIIFFSIWSKGLILGAMRLVIKVINEQEEMETPTRVCNIFNVASLKLSLGCLVRYLGSLIVFGLIGGR